MTSRSDGKARPVADAFAVLDRGAAGDKRRSDFVPLGAVWSTDAGNLRLPLRAEPLAWRDPKVPRVVMIRFRRDVTFKAGSSTDGEPP